jgi:histidinol phosphatase-like PHP family hydrolase
MISINCDVDEIQTAIDTYRIASDKVDDAIDLVVASVHETRLEWGLWWISNFAYMKLLSFVNQNQSVDELIEDLTGSTGISSRTIPEGCGRIFCFS